MAIPVNRCWPMSGDLGAITTSVNEQNGQAVGFYERMGFVPVGRSERDDQGRPYPLIHLRFAARP